MPSVPSFTFDLRGVPCRFSSGQFPGLHATQRGFCPFSSTGYRSLCSSPLSTREDVLAVSEGLAKAREAELLAQSKALVADLRRLKPVLALAAPYSGFVAPVHDAFALIARGLFADVVRQASFWGGAVQMLADLTETFPLRSFDYAGARWTVDDVLSELRSARIALAALRRALGGDVPGFIRLMAHVKSFVGSLSTFARLPAPAVRAAPPPVGQLQLFA